MRALFIAIALLPSVALAGQAKLDANLPFRLKAGTIREETMNGDRFTVIEMTITNGAKYLNSVRIDCKAESRDGFTWSVNGKALNLDPNETRRFNLTSDALDDASRDATKASCRVAGFDAGI